MAKHAAEANKVFAMNLSAPFIPQFFKDQVDSLSEYWDILFGKYLCNKLSGNETEALSYAEVHDLKTRDIGEIALHIASLPKKNSSRSRMVVFTHGALPTVIAKDGELTKVPVIPIETKDIVGTTVWFNRRQTQMGRVMRFAVVSWPSMSKARIWSSVPTPETMLQTLLSSAMAQLTRQRLIHSSTRKLKNHKRLF